MGFLTREKIELLGFNYVGENVKISENAIFYNHANISIGDYTRIDDFCIISAGKGGVFIGRFVHIAPYSSLQGMGKIVMEDFSGLSSKVSIYSSSDDYSGRYLTNPCVSEKYTNVLHGRVLLKKHVIVGVGSSILPNVEIGEGSAIGAFTLVNKDIPKGVVAVGVPAKVKYNRDSKVFELENIFLESLLK